MKRHAILLLAAWPIAAQQAAAPDVRVVPAYPRDGQAVAISWTQMVSGSMKFGTPSVVITPPAFGAGWSYGLPHTVTISQNAAVEGNAAQSVDQETIYVPAVQAGQYTIELQLTIGESTNTYPMADFVVAPACSSQPTASAAYSSEAHGYVLAFDDSLNANVFTGAPELISFAGNRITVNQSLTFAGVPATHPTCLSNRVDLGQIAPGTYHLTWVYLEHFAPTEGLEVLPSLARELTFDVLLPRRRTSRH